jgi:hypothetical protein
MIELLERWFDHEPPSSPTVSFRIEEIKLFRYTFTLAPATEPVTRECMLVVDGAASQLPVENDEFVQDFAMGQVVSVSFVDTDMAGNTSEPTVMLTDAEIIDNVPPSAPNVTLSVAQLPDEQPEEPPTEEPTE